MDNQTPPTILRNLYAKLESMERELNENSPSILKTLDNSPMSPLTLPSNGNPNEMKKQYNITDKMAKLTVNEQPAVPQMIYQDTEYNPTYSARSDSINPVSVQKVRTSNEKSSDFNSPKAGARTNPLAINTFPTPSSRYTSRSEETYNMESPYETDIPRYINGAYSKNYAQYERMRSPNNNYAYTPDSATLYNEVSFPNNEVIPRVDEYGNYLSDYKQQGEYIIQQRQNDYNNLHVNKPSIGNSFDINYDLENTSKSFVTDSVSESISDSKSFLAAAAEIDMDFDPKILEGKSKKLMKNLVNSNNFHKGGNLTICTNILFNKKKTLFYALTTHRLYAFKEDRSEAELIAHYTINKDTKCGRAGIYAGIRNFELTTNKNGSKQREVHEFECTTKEERDEWMHSINKVIQLHKYHDKTLPPPPINPDESYTSTLKSSTSNTGLPTPPVLSPSVSPYPMNGSLNGSINSSMNGGYKSPKPNSKQDNSVSSHGNGGFKIPSMYTTSSPRKSKKSKSKNSSSNGSKHKQPSPNINPTIVMPTTPQMASPNFNYVNRNPNNLPINLLMNNGPPIQNRNPASPNVNYYQRPPTN